MNYPEQWASISGGKDSTYMMLWLIENNRTVEIIPNLKGFVCALIREYEEPDMIKHIYNLKDYAEKNGYEFIILENRNYIEPFMSEVVIQKNSNHYGKVRGFPLRNSPCWISRDWKVKLLDRFKNQREVISGKPIIQHIGYCIDEPSPKRNQIIHAYLKGSENPLIRYPLVDVGVTEEECLKRIKEKGLYCQTHLDYKRSGCWMCQKSPKESRLKAICKYQWRLDKIKEWTKISGREIYIDLTLAEIEAHFKEKQK